jgi:Protein of unknown function (DUF2878)
MDRAMQTAVPDRATPTRWALIANVVLFQIGWFACVIAAAKGGAWLGVLAVLLVAAIHVATSPRPGPAVALLLLVTAIGAVWDSLVQATGWLQYHSGWLVPWLAPVWIVAMWTLFATTLNVALRWMRGHTLSAMLFGLIGGPLAYYGGVKLGALTLVAPFQALLLQGIGWAILTPLLVSLARKYDV